MSKENNIVVGEILFDIFPNKKVLGGAPFNFFYHLQALGEQVTFLSKIGNDDLGNRILDFFKKNIINYSGIQKDDKYPTGKVHVTFENATSPSYEIKENSSWDFLQFNDYVENLLNGNFKLVYFGTLAQRSKCNQSFFENFLNTLKGDPFVFLDLNLREPFYSEKIIRDSLKYCTILKINTDEKRILEDLFNLNDDKDLINFLFGEQGIKTICITAGKEGTWLYRQEEESYYQPSFSVENIVDTVGAGDAFSAYFAYGILNNLPYKQIMEQASKFASKICQIQGAIPKGNEIYTEFLRKV